MRITRQLLILAICVTLAVGLVAWRLYLPPNTLSEVEELEHRIRTDIPLGTSLDGVEAWLASNQYWFAYIEDKNESLIHGILVLIPTTLGNEETCIHFYFDKDRQLCEFSVASHFNGL